MLIDLNEKKSLELICRLFRISTLPWCIMGNFNDLLYSSDKRGTHPYPDWLVRGFHDAIEESLLSEVDLQGGKYTWEMSRGQGNWVQEKLDRAFANAGWWRLFPLCRLSIVLTSFSDHDAIFLELFNVAISKKTFRFKFVNTWLKEPLFVNDVTDHWERIPSTHLVSKLLDVSLFMQKRGRNFFNKFREKKRNQRALLESLKDRRDGQGVTDFFAARDGLNEILLHEELYWKQRVKLFWLKEGDENKKFFHSSATARNKVNHIEFLQKDDGVKVDTQEGM